MVRLQDEAIDPERYIAIAKHKGQWIAGIVDKETAKKFHRTHEGIMD